MVTMNIGLTMLTMVEQWIILVNYIIFNNGKSWVIMVSNGDYGFWMILVPEDNISRRFVEAMAHGKFDDLPKVEESGDFFHIYTSL